MNRIETSADCKFRSIVNPSNDPGSRILRTEQMVIRNGSTAMADTRLRVWAKRNGIEVR